MRTRTLWKLLVVAIVIGLALSFWPNRTISPLEVSEPASGVTASPEYLVLVNGVAITPELVDRELKISRLNVATPLPPLTGDDLVAAQEDALNQLIERQLILQVARRNDFVLSDEIVARYVDLLYGSHSAEELAAALQKVDASAEDLAWWVGEIFTVETFITDVVLADAASGQSQDVYNEWFNALRAEATVEWPRQGEQSPRDMALIGQIAPDFTLATPDGQTVSLSDYRGRVVLVNFWASWCPSCIAEMPDYEAVYQELSPDFVVLGVNFKENGGQVQQYATGLDVSFPVLLDTDGVVTSQQYRLAGMPGSFIIDRAGQIVYRHTGPMSGDTLRRKLAEAGL
jgi:peroxiredoxin